jgi:hypothetical protein
MAYALTHKSAYGLWRIAYGKRDPRPWSKPWPQSFQSGP